MAKANRGFCRFVNCKETQLLIKETNDSFEESSELSVSEELKTLGIMTGFKEIVIKT